MGPPPPPPPRARIDAGWPPMRGTIPASIDEGLVRSIAADDSADAICRYTVPTQHLASSHCGARGLLFSVRGRKKKWCCEWRCLSGCGAQDLGHPGLVPAVHVADHRRGHAVVIQPRPPLGVRREPVLLDIVQLGLPELVLDEVLTVGGSGLRFRCTSSSSMCG